MENDSIKVYKYRWLILVIFMLVVVMNQLLWITFAPVTSIAATFYHVSDLSIGILSMSFMIIFIFFSIPASWVIDTYGFKVAVGIGATLTGVFGLSRGIFADNYNLVLVSQIGIAIGQPFILNAITMIAARWFPLNERVTASGMGSLAMYVGILIGLLLTPYLVMHSGFERMLVSYGIVSMVSAVIFLYFAKEKPPTPSSPPGHDERSLVFDGLRQTFRNRNFLLLMVVFFIGLGVFNSVTTWIEEILNPRHFTVTQAGMAGGLMIAGGIAGAIILPLLSDYFRKRVPFIMLAIAAATLGLAGLAYATSYGLLLVSSFILGFFLLSAGPIGFQYGAEIAYPAPEGTSNGLLLLMGQVSGIAFIFAMDSFKDPVTGSMSSSLLILIGLMIAAFLLSTRLKEPSELINPTPHKQQEEVL
jgi:MFS family permease